MAACSTTPRWIRGGAGALLGAVIGGLIGGGVALGVTSSRAIAVTQGQTPGAMPVWPLWLSIGTPLIGTVVGLSVGARKPNC